MNFSMEGGLTINLDDIKQLIAKGLLLDDIRVVDVVLGAVAANISDTPETVNLYLVGPPSCGKTELIMSLDKLPQFKAVSEMYGTGFISGYKEKGKRKDEHSLLFEIRDKGIKILAFKDFTTILDAREEQRKEVLTKIREIADGEISKWVGNDGMLKWKGKLGILAGVTQAIESHLGAVNKLGERFLYWRMTLKDRLAAGEKALGQTGLEKDWREQLAYAMVEFIESVRTPSIMHIGLPGEVGRKIVALANFVTSVRTAVSRDRYTRVLDYMPIAEGTPRITKQFVNLSRGIAIVQAKDAVDDEIYGILKKIGLDCLPSLRQKLVLTMWVNQVVGDRVAKVKAISQMVKVPESTVRLHLEDLQILGITSVVSNSHGRSAYGLTEDMAAQIVNSLVYSDVPLIVGGNTVEDDEIVEVEQ